MAIDLTTLGGLRAFRDGVELERLVGKRLRAALLVYLAVERRVVRESLMTVFWPESNDENARHALRQTLYQLRADLGADWLEVGPLEVRASATLHTDVHDFTRAIELGHAEAAARLYGGPFLAGVNLVDLQPWESWVEARRTEYARAFRKACRDWVDSRRAQGDLQGAIEAAQCWVAPDPLDDEAQHRLIAALAEAGERSAAIQQYETYERLLQAEELHALDETIALIERVRSEGAVGPALPPTPVATEQPSTEQPTLRESSHRAVQPIAVAVRELAATRRATFGRAIAISATVVVLLLSIAWAVRLRRSETQPVVSTAGIAVLPFSVSGDADAAYLGAGMVNLLGTALDGASVRPVDARAVFAIVAQHGDRTTGLEQASRVAARLGAALFVMGDVIQAGQLLRIEAAVYRAGEGSAPVSKGAVSGDAEHVFELVDNLAAQLLAGLGAAPGDRLTKTAALTTPSLAAFKNYLQGETEIRAGRFERAEEAYLRALAYDSTFALAHYRLALARDWAASGDSEEAGRAAGRHAERLTPRDRALLEALQAYTAGESRDAERRYRAILARYPDDLEAWLQLGEVLTHYGPVNGRPNAESEAAWRKVLSYEPTNPSAIVHLARIATADGRTETLDSLLAPFDAAEQATDRRLLQVAALRAIARTDSSTVRMLGQNTRGWEDAAVFQFAAYLTAFSNVPSGARQTVEDLIEPRRAADVNAYLHWFVALLHLENGQLAAARRAMTAARAANRSAAAQRHGRMFELVTEWWAASLPLPYPDSTLDRIRRTAASTDASEWHARDEVEPAPTASNPIWLGVVTGSLGRSNRMEALRLYTIGTLSLRLRDAAAASTASASLARLAASPASDWFVRACDAELRARRALHDGRAEQGLRILDEQEFGAVSVSATNIVPFFAHAQRRYLRGELLTSLKRDAEALPWFASLGSLSVPESPFRGLAHLRQAEIHERLGNRQEAARHYARFVELWQDSDPELQPLVESARRRRAALPLVVR